MGYDMYLKGGPVEGEEEAIEAARAKFEQAVLYRDEIHDQAGTWMTDEEKALPDEERHKISKSRHEAMHKLIEEGEGVFIAHMKAGAIPATEEYIRRFKLADEASDEVDRANKSYFRLNISGMGFCIDVMNTYDMVKDRLPGRFPEVPDELSDSFLWDTLDEAYYECDKDVAETRELVLSSEWQAKYRADAQEYKKDDDDPTVVELTPELFEIAAKFWAENESHLRVHDEAVPGIAINKFDSNDGWHVTKEECASALEMWNAADEGRRNKTLAEIVWWAGWIEFLRNGAERDGFTVH